MSNQSEGRRWSVAARAGLPAVALLLFSFAAMQTPAAGAPERRSCAVLTFQAADPADADEAVLLASRFSVVLEQAPGWDAWPRIRVNRTLAARGYSRTLYRSDLDAAAGAGRVLDVDCVVFGRVAREGRDITLTTTLVEARTGKALRRAISRYAGPMDRFLELAPRHNAKLLLDIEPAAPPVPAAPAAAAPAPAAPRPAEPVVRPRPPRPARPPSEPRPSPFAPLRRKTAEWWQQRGEWAPAVAAGARTARAFVSDHLRVGTRLTSFSLDKTSSGAGTFIGTINRLEEDPDRSLWNPFAGWYFTPNVGIECWTDKARAEASATEDGHVDGVFVVEGPVLAVMGRLPADQLLRFTHARWQWPARLDAAALEWASRIAPYMGIGRAFYDASFEHAKWWRYGYATRDDWLLLGRPDTFRHGHTRYMETSGEDGTVFMLGVSVRAYDRWSVELSWSRVSVDVAADFYMDGRLQESANIPMTHTTTGLGISYFF